ncbi:hypothetical protein HDR58_09520 [bacterium]|nr:hypothetical protein [bacterium]
MKNEYTDPYINRQTGTLKNFLGISDNDKLQTAEAKITGIAMGRLNRDPVQGNFDFAHLCKIHEKIFEKIYEWAGTPRTVNFEKAERALAGLSVEYSKYDEIEKDAAMVIADMKKVNWKSLPLEQRATEFSRCMADLWKVHPFREGNTRTTVTFCCDFAESRGFGLDRDLFKDNSEYVRTALVAASAKFSDEYVRKTLAASLAKPDGHGTRAVLAAATENFTKALGDRSQPEHLCRIIKDGMERWEEAHLAKDNEISMGGHAQGNKMSMDDYKEKISKARKSAGKDYSAEPKREHGKSDSRSER